MIFCRWAESATASEGEARRESRMPDRREERRDARGSNGREPRPREYGDRPTPVGSGTEAAPQTATPAGGGLATAVSNGDPGTKPE
jgi:hypothetical protein